MKRTHNILKALVCAVMLGAGALLSHAADGIIENRDYWICPGDTIHIDSRQTIVFKDTVLYDTIHVADPSMDSIYRYIVNVYPAFLDIQERTVERGSSFDWCGITISKAGLYERVYKSVIGGCDSIYRVKVRERVETHLMLPLCEGSSMTFGNQTLTEGGLYRDSIHFSDYDSIVVLNLKLVKPDSTITNSRIPEGTFVIWNGKECSEAGVYDSIIPNRFGCDSLTRLVLTTYHIDTIDTTAVLCPAETITWHGMTYGQTGDYEFPGFRENGDRVHYRLHLTVKDVVRVDTTFTLCDEETLTFRGKVYANAGEYDDHYTCDTLYRIKIVKHPSQVYVQNGVLDAINPYLWQYMLDGELKTDTILTPGIYEYTSQDPATGCNDIYRLILTRDETSYHFDTAAVVCENEYFEWRGRKNLNRQGIGTTTHYYDSYKTAAGYDSIYHLSLRVLPVLRKTQTVPFCGSIVWNGETVSESKTVIDTLQSMQYGCDSIVTTNLLKGIPFHYHDTVTIHPGETIEWRGHTITHEGQYSDSYVSKTGCDSIYSLGVGLKADEPYIKTRTWRESICEGDYLEWNKKKYFNSGTFVDTIFTDATKTVIDSLHILILTVNNKYSYRERVTFHTFPSTYRGWTFTSNGEEHEFKFTSIGGCDSIITVVAEQEVARFEETVVICPNDVFIWDWDGLTYNESGRYIKTEKDINGNDSVEHILNLTVRYIPDTYIKKTICKGGSYTFGDRVLTTSGNYVYTFHDTDCDSVVHLSLNVLNADTNVFVHHMDPHDTYVWNGETYSETGVYYHYGTNRFGCDSISILELTVNHVDTVSGVQTICPNEVPYVWNGIVASQTGQYDKAVKQANGDYIYYHLDLKVLELVEIDTMFILCGDQSVTFNSQTYTEAGSYRSYLSCDTLMNIRIVKHPQQLYETHATLGGDHGYTWTYWNNGEEKTDTFTEVGTYEYESPNAITGCSEIWRLILTKDETEYHFIETRTICEGEPFTWRGLENLSNQPGENHYFVNYQTRTGKDSIYELVLTVTPIERTVRTITFCGDITWKGKTYVNSAVVYDTIASSSGCYRIERVNLDKATPFYQSETKQLPQGTVLHWHGQNITTDGTYYDYQTTIHGCDSIYTITVTIIPASPETNQYAEELSACEGDTIVWRGKDIWRSGVYVDTIYKAGTQNIDSIFTLKFTAWPAPKDTIYQHLFSCTGKPIRYNGVEYTDRDTIVTVFHTIHGCDSVVKTYLHFNEALYLTETDTIVDTELPYRWIYKLADPLRQDTIVTTSNTYSHKVTAEGGCTNEEYLHLVVLKTYLFELDTTICETDLPFIWRGQALQHAIGETKQYEDVLQTVNNTDSIYRLHLTIDPAPKRTIQLSFCENKDTVINGKSYFDKKYIPGEVYRDTAYVVNPGNVCDSIIYYEITKIPQRRVTETRILHEGESFDWHGYTIDLPVTRTYTIEDEIDPATGCANIYELRVVAENRKEVTICSIDTAADTHPDKKYPYEWVHPRGNVDTLYTSAIYTDTVFDPATGYISEFNTLDLHVTQPYDTTIYVHGCQNKGVVWRDFLYKNDTVFVDRVEVTPYTPDAPCDSVFHVHIVMDTIYETVIDTIICETELPFVLGRKEPILLWEEYVDPITINDETVCGCDSTITLTLRIIPTMDRNDSTFVCEDFFANGGAVYLGDTIHPWFDHQYHGEWEGKWHGVKYTDDTIVWNCDSTYFHHIIKRPSQKVVKDTVLYLCPDDSLQLFWPRDDSTWFFKDTLYEEHVPMPSTWTDDKHGYTYHNDAYTCDSVTIWHIKKLERFHKDTTAHILLGDSLWWGGEWRYYSGVYDSLAPSPDTSSFGDTCMYIYPLTLIVDTGYYFRDTITLCTNKNTTYSHIWEETGHEQFFTVGRTDTIARHYFDSLKTYNRRDSVYDLCVNYSIIRDTLLFDTICEDSRYRFDSLHQTMERWIDRPGRYRDTVTAINGCDSIIILQLYVRPRVVTTPKRVMITDRDLPYIWKHAWKENGLPKDSTDTLRTSGLYTFLMPNKFGCDSIDSLYLTVHYTHVFRDTISICAPIKSTHQHKWSTDYIQKFTTPSANDTIHYIDTLDTRIKLDSIYDLFVDFHRTYETHRYDTICAGDSAYIDTHNHSLLPKLYFKETGIYRDTVKTIDGCDSILTLHLQVWPGFPTTHKRADIADVDTPYLWAHSWMEKSGLKRDTDTLYIAGEYRRVLPNIHGCDSIDSLSLHIHKTYRLWDDTLNICAKETPFTWRGLNNITKTGDYQYGEQTIDGYDSIHYVHIIVWKQTYDTTTAHICEGDSIRWGMERATLKPRFVSKTGLYNDTLLTIHGCDSIRVLRLTVYPRYIKETTVHIADVDTPYVWKHFNAAGDSIGVDSLYASDKYGFRFASQYACDSIDSLKLVIHNTYKFVEEIAICERETPYTWQNRNDITTSGTYYFNARTHDGYDSIYIATITVHPTVRETIRHSMCEGSEYLFDGKTFYKDTTVMDTLLTYEGCDSIVTLILTVNQPYHHVEKVDILEGQSVEFFGNTYTTSGTYTHFGTTPGGCDSTSILQLTVHQLVDTIITRCSSELPLIWYNKWSGKEELYYAAGTYRNDSTFDSRKHFYGMQLIVNEPVFKTITHSMCEGSEYMFGGKTYKTGVTVKDTLRAFNGCDSIVTLILTVNKPYHHVEKVDILEGQSVEFFGNTYTTSGTYTHFGTTPEGCDSTSILQLTVHQLIDTVITVCSSELPYAWLNKWSGEEELYYAAGTYRNDSTFDSRKHFYGMQLIVNEPVFKTITHSMCEGSEYLFGGKTYKTGVTVKDTLRAFNGCDSIVTLILTVNKPYHHVEKVDILEGQSVEFFGNTYTTSGTYTHFGTTPEGCDSTSILQLTVHQLIDTVITVCSSELPYVWLNKWSGEEELYYAAGTYRNDSTFDSRKHFYGMQLIVNEPSFKTIAHSMCEGSEYLFGGKTYKTGVTVKDTLRAFNGCDSIVTLILTVNKPYHHVEKVDILEGQSVEFFGNTYTTSGTYTHFGTTPEGCDSTSILQLTVHQLIDTVITVCSSELPYVWHNKWSGEEELYYAAGTYRNDSTFDSRKHFYGMQLIVNEPVFKTITHSMCEGSEYLFGGKTYKTGVTVKDTLRAFNGCDSIVTLILTVNKPYHHVEKVDILEGQSVEFFGNTYTTSGTYTHFGTTPEGCDSTSILQLTVHQLIDTVITVCSSELPYVWLNKWSGEEELYYAAGTYRNDSTFDSRKHFYGMQLIVNEPSFKTITHSMCEGSTFTFKGESLTQSGTYKDTLTAKNGCDSIVTLILTVNKPYYHLEKVDILEGQSTEFFGNTYTTSGTYTHFGTTPEGCDSTSILQLTVHQLIDTVITVCSSELPYVWHNKWSGEEELYYAAGTYRNDSTFDSRKHFYGMQLIVNEPVFKTITHSMCEGSTFTFKGESLTQSGTYKDTLTAKNGCDSIVTLILTVNKPYYHVEKIDILEGQSVEFFGNTYTTTGTYTHFGTTPEGCDSTSILQLAVHQLVDTVVTICSNELPYPWINKWTGETTLLYHAGLYRNDTTYVNGQKMYYGLQLNVNMPSDTTIYRSICEGSYYQFNGMNLNERGEYRDTLKNAVGCDSIVILQLTVLQNYHHVISRTIFEGDTVHFENNVYDKTGRYPFRYTSSFGCDSIIELNLIVNKLFDDSISICYNDLPLVWRNKEIYQTGIFRDTTYDSDGTQVISGLRVTVLPTYRAPEPIVKTICEGDYYSFNGQNLTIAGTYYDTLTATNGCDSIVSLSLQVIPQYTQSLTKIIYEGDSVFFNGEWKKESGIYEYAVKNSADCEDTYRLTLTVLKQFNVDTTAYICQNDLPFVWNGLAYSAAGDYAIPTSWTDSSRVVTTLHLVVNESYYFERNVSLCEGSTYIYKNREYTQSGSFYDTIPSKNGCDSIIRYIITVHPTYDRIDTVHISDKQSYDFNGRILNQSGYYESSSSTIHGCDSMVHLVLIVHPSYYNFDSINLCQGDTLDWHGQKIFKTGLYSDSLLTETYSFDSVYQVRVIVHPKYYIEQQYEITEGYPTFIHGINISTPGVYYDSLYTIHGCDSVYQIVVNWARKFTQHQSVTICQGEYYEFFGMKLTHAGEYDHTSLKGDSTIYLKLTVNPTSVSETRLVISEEDLPYIYNERTYASGGTYSDTLQNRFGCDSIIRLVLVVSEHASAWEQIPLCPGQELKIDGEIINKAGLYTFVKRSKVSGLLDSLYRVEVFDAPDFESGIDSLVICEGDTVEFAGKKIWRGGMHTANLKTKNGCDSILHMHLTINPSYLYPTSATITDYQSYTWRGKEYTKQGVYEQSYPTIKDCDSTYQLRLTVIQTKRIVVNDSICYQDTLRWRDHILTDPGTYSDTICNLASLTSIIYTLNLGVVTPTIITSATVTETAADVESFNIYFTYSGLRPNTYSIQFDELAHKEGFTDIVNKPFGTDIIAEVPMPHKTQVIYQEHTAYVRPNYYTMRLALDNSVCGISRSDSLSLLIRYPSWILEQNWDDVVAPLRSDYNGGYEFGAYTWYVNDAVFPNDGLPYLYSKSLRPGDKVELYATRIGESYAIPTAPLIISAPVPNVTNNPVLVYPTATSKLKPRVTLEAQNSGSYKVYSPTGKLFSTGEFESGESSVELPAVSGCCIIQATTEDGYILTQKIIIY